MAKRKTATQKEYSKQRARLLHAIRRNEKQGYIFPEDILPDIPKRITKASVRKLAKIKPADLRYKAEYLIEETGELIKVKGNTKEIKADIKRKKDNYKAQFPKITAQEYFPSFTDNVINRFKTYILGFPKGISDMVLPLINTLIQEQGADSVATALENMPLQFHEYLHRHKHDSNGGVQEFATSLIEYLPDASPQYKKDLMDRFEFEELGYIVEDEET